MPPEVRIEMLVKAGASACANLSVTCTQLKDLIQRDEILWNKFFQRDLIDVRDHPTYDEYVDMPYGEGRGAYRWYWHVLRACCEVCHWYCRLGLVRCEGLDVCRDCERDLLYEYYRKIYDV